MTGFCIEARSAAALFPPTTEKTPRHSLIFPLMHMAALSAEHNTSTSQKIT